MRVKRTIIYPESENLTSEHWVANLPQNDQIRAALEAGTLVKATLEFDSGTVMTFEPVEE